MLTRSLWSRYRGEIPVYLAALIGLAICLALWDAYEVEFSLGGVWKNAQLFIASLGMMGIFLLTAELIQHRPDRPIAWLAERARTGTLPNQLLAGLPMLIMCIVVVPVFSNLKSMIPLFTEYTWDATFISWDRALFAGHDPWRVLQPFLGYPAITALIAVPYHLWLLLLYPGAAYFAFAARVDERLRRQFFLSYLMGWFLIGGALATAFASVGPVFLAPLLGDDTFADLNAYLLAANAEYPVMVVRVQAMLLDGFAQNARSLGSGITAMPSMHIAICVLYWLAARRLSRGSGQFFAVFGLIIWVGSVHTGYHYAVDGLVSLFAMMAVWWAAGAVVCAWDRFLARNVQPALRTNTVPTE